MKFYFFTIAIIIVMNKTIRGTDITAYIVIGTHTFVNPKSTTNHTKL